MDIIEGYIEGLGRDGLCGEAETEILRDHGEY